MGKVVSGTFVACDAAVNVDIGFEPDYVELFSALGGTELGFKYFKCLADAATSGQYGLAIANAGDISACADANNGIIPYEGALTPSVLVESPKPGIGKLRVPVVGFVAGTAQPTARSATVIGTIVRPSVKNGYVYECTTSGGVFGTEPTWGTTIGGTTSDGTNTWTCRAEETTVGGGRGFTVGATLATNSEIWVFKAEKHDRQGDMGDADDTNPVQF